MTRFEQIRKMKARELAEWLCSIVQYKDKDGNRMATVFEPKENTATDIRDSVQDWSNWLQSETKKQEK